MKPKQLPAMTGTLPMALAKATAETTVSVPARSPRTTSTSRMTLAGEKK